MTQPPRNQSSVHTQFQAFSDNPHEQYSWWYIILKWLRYHIRITVVVLTVFLLGCIFVTAEVSAPQNVRPSSVLQQSFSYILYVKI